MHIFRPPDTHSKVSSPQIAYLNCRGPPQGVPMRSVLVTGGTGYLGQFLVRELDAAGYRVRGPVIHRPTATPKCGNPTFIPWALQVVATYHTTSPAAEKTRVDWHWVSRCKTMVRFHEEAFLVGEYAFSHSCPRAGGSGQRRWAGRVLRSPGPRARGGRELCRSFGPRIL